MEYIDENNPLIIECKLKTQQFFNDFDTAKFDDKIKVIIEFVESNIQSVENAKKILGANSEEFFFYSDCIYMMAASKFIELMNTCQNELDKRKLLFLPVSDKSYGETMFEQYMYIFVQIFPSGPVKGWPFNQDAINAWNLPLLEFGNLKDQNNSSDGGGCYIATMAYGDYEHPQVVILRNFRDETLAKSLLGRWFVKTYYHYSPILVEKLKDFHWINKSIRTFLNLLIKFIK
ncbi:MAG: hypothetical protein RJA76_47 [Bacteroidota bacterium]|jgi:hypothetical protein